MGLAGGINTHEHVAGNPVSSINPLGLVKWGGTYYFRGFGHKVGATSWFRFSLTSECVNNERWMVTVEACGAGVGDGAWPVSNIGGSISFEDVLDSINPWVFEGQFAAMYVGGAVGIGYSWSAYRLGGALSNWSGALQGGFDGGTFFEIAGRSTVERVQGPFCCTK